MKNAVDSTSLQPHHQQSHIRRRYPRHSAGLAYGSRPYPQPLLSCLGTKMRHLVEVELLGNAFLFQPGVTSDADFLLLDVAGIEAFEHYLFDRSRVFIPARQVRLPLAG